MKTHRILKKLKSKNGESLGEVLIALLIAALALTMLASVISSASNMISNSKEKMTLYYGATNDVASSKSGAHVVKSTSSIVTTVAVSGNVKGKSTLTYTGSFTRNVDTYTVKDDIIGDIDVVAYKMS